MFYLVGEATLFHRMWHGVMKAEKGRPMLGHMWCASPKWGFAAPVDVGASMVSGHSVWSFAQHCCFEGSAVRSACGSCRSLSPVSPASRSRRTAGPSNYTSISSQLRLNKTRSFWCITHECLCNGIQSTSEGSLILALGKKTHTQKTKTVASRGDRDGCACLPSLF